MTVGRARLPAIGYQRAVEKAPPPVVFFAETSSVLGRQDVVSAEALGFLVRTHDRSSAQALVTDRRVRVADAPGVPRVLLVEPGEPPSVVSAEDEVHVLGQGAEMLGLRTRLACVRARGAARIGVSPVATDLVARAQALERRVSGLTEEHGVLRSIVQHDLRGPVAVLLGRCALLDEEGPTRVRAAVPTLVRQAQRIADILDAAADRIGAAEGLPGGPSRAELGACLRMSAAVAGSAELEAAARVCVDGAWPRLIVHAAPWRVCDSLTRAVLVGRAQCADGELLRIHVQVHGAYVEVGLCVSSPHRGRAAPTGRTHVPEEATHVSPRRTSTPALEALGRAMVACGGSLHDPTLRRLVLRFPGGPAVPAEPGAAATILVEGGDALLRTAVARLLGMEFVVAERIGSSGVHADAGQVTVQLDRAGGARVVGGGLDMEEIPLDAHGSLLVAEVRRRSAPAPPMMDAQLGVQTVTWWSRRARPALAANAPAIGVTVDLAPLALALGWASFDWVRADVAYVLRATAGPLTHVVHADGARFVLLPSAPDAPSEAALRTAVESCLRRHGCLRPAARVRTERLVGAGSVDEFLERIDPPELPHVA
jgi:hypothetical protein